MTIVTLIQAKHLIGVAHIFRGLFHYHHGAKLWHTGRLGAGQVAECLNFDLQTKGSSLRHWGCLECMRPQSPLKQWCTSCNKSTPIPTKPHLPLGTIFFQTTNSDIGKHREKISDFSSGEINSTDQWEKI